MSRQRLAAGTRRRRRASTSGSSTLRTRARRRVALAQIRQYPDAVLRMRAHEVERFDDDLARLADRMAQLMHDARGVGLAATQVGVLQRLFVFQQPRTTRSTAIVNPEITKRSRATEVADEGCLSLQGVLVPVERAATVTLEGQDLTGEPLGLELEEIDARVVQHELDHLDGVLMLERTDDESRARGTRPRCAAAVARPSVRPAAHEARRSPHGAVRRGRARAARRPARGHGAADAARPAGRGAAAGSPRRRPRSPRSGWGSPCSSRSGRPPSSTSRATRSSSPPTAC